LKKFEYNFPNSYDILPYNALIDISFMPELC